MEGRGVGRRERKEEVVQVAELGEHAGVGENAGDGGDGGSGYARVGGREQVLEKMPAEGRVIRVLEQNPSNRLNRTIIKMSY